MRVRPAHFLCAAACAVLAAGGCGKKGLPNPTANQAGPSKTNLRRSVELARAGQKTIVSTVEQVGTLEARQTTDIAAGVAGVVDEVLFDEGQQVDPAANKPLIKVDQEKFLRAVEAAEAAEKRATAMAARAKDISYRAETGMGAVSEGERRQSAESLRAAEADILTATANLKLAKHNLDRSRVLPPYRGQINQRKVTPGSYVKEDTVIATIADLAEIRLVGYVPESATPAIRRRMADRPRDSAARTLAVGLAGTAGGWDGFANRIASAAGEVPAGFDPEFTVPSLPRRTFRAEIFYMSTVADSTTHMFECKARINPRDPLLTDLKPGFTARIRFPYESTPGAVVVPEEAVRATERGFLLFVPEKKVGKDGAVEWVARSRRVEVGARAPGWVEARSGVVPGQWVVQRGAEALDDGVPLRIPDDQLKLLEQ